MNLTSLLIIIILMTGEILTLSFQVSSDKNQIITAIQDNGCSKQAQIELSPTKTNAQTYNYAALSTSY